MSNNKGQFSQIPDLTSNIRVRTTFVGPVAFPSDLKVGFLSHVPDTIRLSGDLMAPVHTIILNSGYLRRNPDHTQKSS